MSFCFLQTRYTFNLNFNSFVELQPQRWM